MSRKYRVQGDLGEYPEEGGWEYSHYAYGVCHPDDDQVVVVDLGEGRTKRTALKRAQATLTRLLREVTRDLERVA